MRILMLSYERNLELEERGHEILYVDRNTAVSPLEIATFEPDLVIEREFNDGKAYYDELLNCDALRDVSKAWWWIDSHISFDQRKAYARNFDYVFLAVSANVESLKAYLGHDRVYWLPLCYPYRSDVIVPNNESKEHELSFVGRWNREWFPERTAYIELLKQKYGDRFYAVTDYENMLSIVRRSKVSFNCSIRGDLNFRVFEVLGCGTELLTDDVPDLHKIGALADRLTIYKNGDDLLECSQRLLGSDPRHDTLSNQEWITTHHCLVNRHLSLLTMIESGAQETF